MATVEELKEITGVYVVRPDEFADERGRFVETYRRGVIPGAGEMLQQNRSDSKAGTLRGMHYHLFQADYSYLASGSAVCGLYDFRESSPTFKSSALVDLDGIALYVPPGVAHGFLALTDMTLFYLVDQLYDGSDELGFRYDDPALGFEWPRLPELLSERDRSAPFLEQIPPENRPG